MIDSTTARLIRERRTSANGALIGYLPVGFPTLDASIDAAEAMVRGGVDIIELGLPYSDPVMDGPVIQAATVEALQNGFRVADVFTAVREISQRVDAPILIMSYWNLVLQYGVGRFADALKSAGGAGLITPDLVPDEAAEWLRVSDEIELDRIFLAAPTSSDARLKKVTELSRGFVYTVSTMGVTGTRTGVDQAAKQLVSRLRAVGCTESCVGLGISTGDQVREVLDYGDGAIVGSVLVRALATGGASAVREVAEELATGSRPSTFGR